MIGLILAAGKGQRIQEISNGLPKSFLELGGKAIIDHQLDALKTLDLDYTLIVNGFRKALFEEQFDRDGINFVTNPFFDRTNVLASVWFAREHLLNGFLFMHADTYFEPSILGDLYNHSGDAVLAVCRKESVPEEMKVIVKGDRVRTISKELPCEDAFGEFTGVAKVSPKAAQRVVSMVVHRIEQSGDHDCFFEVVLQDLVDEGNDVIAFDIGKRVSIEIDSPEDYEEARHIRFSQEEKGAQPHLR